MQLDAPSRHPFIEREWLLHHVVMHRMPRLDSSDYIVDQESWFVL